MATNHVILELPVRYDNFDIAPIRYNNRICIEFKNVRTESIKFVW